MAMENVIEIENVSKSYRLGEIGGGTLRGDLQSWWARLRHREDPNLLIGTDTSAFGSSFMALDNLSLTVKKGEAVGIIGHNGAGKSTLLKLLSRVTAPSSGEIRLKGRIASMLEVGTGFHPELTGRENIYMNGAILGMSRKEVDSKIEEIIDFSECRQFIDTPVKRYSSGMYVKLAFSVAAHLDAEIMVMDEVLAVGDMKFQKKCLGKMGAEAQGGKTVLYVSHNMSTIRQLCSRCVVLSHGRIIFDGDVEEAIAIYMQESEVGISRQYDLSCIERGKGYSGKMLARQIDIENDIPLAVGEKLKLRLYYTIKEKGIYKPCARFIISNSQQQNVGAAMTELGAAEGAAEESTGLYLDTDILAPGIYNADLVLYEMDEHGQQQMHDGVRAFSFEITENSEKTHGFKWYRPWGSVMIGAGKLVI